MRVVAIALLWCLAPVFPAVAGEADVVKVIARQEGDGRFGFVVTVRHGDTGWKHYADRWDVVGPDGTVLASREPCASPCRRAALSPVAWAVVAIPAGIRRVRVRAHDSVHGLGGAEMAVELPGR